MLQFQIKTKYTEVSGTVCCISERHGVSGVRYIGSPVKMMIVNLDDGRKVDVKIEDVPYVSGKRILLREVRNLETGTHYFVAVRYL